MCRGCGREERSRADGPDAGTVRCDLCYQPRGPQALGARDRKPRGTALVLLNVIAKDPQAVLRAWSARDAMSRKLEIVRGGDNIFIDLGFDQVVAENLKMRSDLMIRIVEFHRKRA